MEFSEPAIIGGITLNLATFTLFCLLIIYFAMTGRMAKMFGWNKNHKNY
tara:strand:- start:373 stop:519 length:147 start_codon:yes stop_codon:yes gene_type:complete